jgi:hypothetical protein
LLSAKAIKYSIGFVAVCIVIAVAWKLFGSIPLRDGYSQGRAYKSWGRIVRYDWDQNHDGITDTRTLVPWAYANRDDLVCFPRTYVQDRDFNGSWDFWAETDGGDFCVKFVQVDEDFDGTPDWSAKIDDIEWPRIFAGTRTSISIATFRVYGQQIPNPCSRIEFSSPEVREVACWGERHGLTPDQTLKFWRRVVKLEYRDGYERETAEQLAAGLLTDSHDHWPTHVVEVYGRALESGVDVATATEEAGSYFFEYTWGQGSAFRKDYSPPPEPTKNPQYVDVVVVPPDPGEEWK